MSQTENGLSKQIHGTLKNVKNSKFNFKTILAMFIFGMIVVVFVFSGIMGKSSQLGLGAAAEVNGDIISIKQFQDQEARISAYYSQMLGGQFENFIQKRQLQNEALNQLIDNSAAAQAAQKEKIQATDANIRDMIQQMPYFKKDGVFQIDLYRGILSNNGMTPADFEKSLRQQIAIQKVRDVFAAGTVVTQLEKNIDQALKASQINIEYLKITPEALDSGHQGIAQIENELKNEDFLKKVKEYYGSHASEFETPEQVKASHILISADFSKPDDAQKAEQKARDVLKQVQNQDFAKLATKYSDDPGSKAKGGDLGYFGRGNMVKEFEEATFALNKGQISGLVKTSYGYHIIKLLDKKPATKKTEAEAQMMIAKKLMTEEKTKKLAKKAEELLKSNPDRNSLAQFAKENSLSLSETGFFDLTAEAVPGITNSSALSAAFDLTQEKPVHKSLIKEGDTYYLLALKGMKNESGAQAAEVMKYNEMLSQQKIFSQYQSWLESYKKKFTIHKNEALLQ